MSETDESEKEFDPSPRKLEEARRRGDLVKSTEINVAAAYAGLLIAFMALADVTIRKFGEVAAAMIAHSDRLSWELFRGGAASLSGGISEAVIAILPWFLFPGVTVLAAIFAQRSLVFSGEKLMPKFNRIDPIANAKQKFGRSGLFEFAKSFVKLNVIGILLGFFLWRELDLMLAAQHQAPGGVLLTLGSMIVEFLILLAVIAAVLGGLDYLWQRFEFLRRNRMTRKELMDEMKQSEGDPHLKAQRRQKGIEIATRQMLGDVAKADVVIVNPTHYAVALKWDRASRRAPICVAKGVDEIARRIREIAMESGVPIHSDPPTARALFAAVEIDQEIQPEHYKPVAAAIRFAEKMRRVARRRL